MVNSIIYMPQLYIEIDGAPMDPEDAGTLSEMRIHRRLSLPTLCELTFREPLGPLSEPQSVGPGLQLKVSLAGENRPMLFDGDVTATEYIYGPDGRLLVRVRSYDPLHRLRKRQPVRSHMQVTLAELAETMVSDLGLGVRTEVTGPLHPHLVQYRQSDLTLMTQTAENCGLYYVLQDRTLHFVTLEGSAPPVPLRLGSSLIEASVEINADTVSRKVTVTGWDSQRMESRRGEAHTARCGRAIAAEPESAGEPGERVLVDETAQTDEQLEAIAQAELDRRKARTVVMTGVAEGNPQIIPGARIRVDGVAGSLAGTYVVTGVNHTIDRNAGFVSQFTTCPPVAPPRPRETLTSWGRVSRVDDPEAWGRVRVVLPNYNGIETDWLPVVTPGAGRSKGLMAFPDVDDHVLVLLLNADPSQAVVLGGLYGTLGPGDSLVADAAVCRYTFLTPDGQRLRLDDENQCIRMDSRDGSWIELTPDAVHMADRTGSRMELTPDACRLQSKADLIIEAPGQSVTIRGEQIHFRKG